MKYILASASPRRRELLKKTGIDFDVFPSSIEEKITKTTPAEVLRVIPPNHSLSSVQTPLLYIRRKSWESRKMKRKLSTCCLCLQTVRIRYIPEYLL